MPHGDSVRLCTEPTGDLWSRVLNFTGRWGECKAGSAPLARHAITSMLCEDIISASLHRLPVASEMRPSYAQ